MPEKMSKKDMMKYTYHMMVSMTPEQVESIYWAAYGIWHKEKEPCERAATLKGSNY